MTEINRRDALAALLAMPGLTILPITSHAVGSDGDLLAVVLKVKPPIGDREIANLARCWREYLKDSALGHVPMIVLDANVEIELIRRRGPTT